jgi:hypothetical protein
VRDRGGIGGPGEGRWGVDGRGEGGRREKRRPLGDRNASMISGERKMRKMSKDGFSLWGLGNNIILVSYGNVCPTNNFRGVSPSSFLRTFFSRRALTG